LCPFFVWEDTDSRWVDDFAGHCLLWQLLLRLAFVVVVALILLLPQNSLLTLLASAPDSGVSNQNFTFGFLLQFY